MTIREALKSEVSYPIPKTFFDMIFIKRGLKGEDEFTSEVAAGRLYRLAYADCLKRHIAAPNVAEPGLNISLTYKDKLISIANSIYSEYGEPLVQIEAVPVVEYIGEEW